MVYARLVGYVYVIYHLLVFFSSRSRFFFKQGIVVATLMSLLNILLILDATAKFSKFMTMKLEDQGKKKRRSSLAMQQEIVTGPTTELRFSRRLSQPFVAAEAREANI